MVTSKQLVYNNTTSLTESNSTTEKRGLANDYVTKTIGTKTSLKNYNTKNQNQKLRSSYWDNLKNGTFCDEYKRD